MDGKTLNIKNKSRGLTLMETLVAIGILSVAISGPLMLSARGLIFAKYAKDQIIAFYLAQEAVEIVRNIRDGNLKAGGNWLDGLEQCIDHDCLVDVWTIGDTEAQGIGWNKGILPCPVGVCPAVKVLESQEVDLGSMVIYGHQFNVNSSCDTIEVLCNDSSFVRRFSLTRVEYPDDDPSFQDEVVLSVVVTWKRGTINKDLVISENLFNL